MAEAAELMSLPRNIGGLASLASKEGAPIWAEQKAENCSHHYVSMPIPDLKENESLFQYFHGRQFLRLLPLLLFVRALADDKKWERPPLRACFTLDDPNLHWRTYGFVDYSNIAVHAKRHNYHVSFAMIPLDTWFEHKSTVDIFKKYPNQLSLLIHGNDHTARELASPDLGDKTVNKLHQALNRMLAFERRTNVEVSRVMAPPHGACNENALASMACLGFEAATISRGSLRHHNKGASWLGVLGMRPSDVIAGLPVLPRFPLNESCHNSILIAALLDQPIIAAGHHQDVADGLQLLSQLSGFVNSLGSVYWADMRRIARSHFAQCLDGDILRVRMYSRHVHVNVPEGVRQLWIDRPPFQAGELIPFVWRKSGDASEWKSGIVDKPIEVLPKDRMEVRFGPITVPFGDKNLREFRLWPVARRQLTEVRDRLAPVLKMCSAYFINSKGM
ncbi:hypothetical protein [Nitrospira sp. BLG_1]|uniref:hypothetical protein n=1 Tax=Nitrospira sp. BLG_1 TaxID=3395883 RepID=UPI0039BC5F4E